MVELVTVNFTVAFPVISNEESKGGASIVIVALLLIVKSSLVVGTPLGDQFAPTLQLPVPPPIQVLGMPWLAQQKANKKKQSTNLFIQADLVAGQDPKRFCREQWIAM